MVAPVEPLAAPAQHLTATNQWGAGHRDYEHSSRECVAATYALNHQHQTLAFVCEQERTHGRLDKLKVGSRRGRWV